MAVPPLPPWLSNTTSTSTPLLTLTLSPCTIPKEAPFFPAELADCRCDLEQSHLAWLAHKKETSWRLRRVELKLESEKTIKRRDNIEQFETKLKALEEEQAAAMDRIDAEYKEQVLVLRREAEAKEQKLVEQLAAKHTEIGRLIQQLGCCRR